MGHDGTHWNLRASTCGPGHQRPSLALWTPVLIRPGNGGLLSSKIVLLFLLALSTCSRSTLTAKSRTDASVQTTTVTSTATSADMAEDSTGLATADSGTITANDSCAGEDSGVGSAPDAGGFTAIGYGLRLAAGQTYTCVIRADGSVLCWGGLRGGESMPPAGAFTQISARGDQTCGLRPDGGLACWGGLATPADGSFSQISVGSSHACGLRPNGCVVCWGDNSYGQSTPPAGVYSQISAGEIGIGLVLGKTHGLPGKYRSRIRSSSGGTIWKKRRMFSSARISFASGVLRSCSTSTRGSSPALPRFITPLLARSHEFTVRPSSSYCL